MSAQPARTPRDGERGQRNPQHRLAWELTAPEVSWHLAVLRMAGLPTMRRRGRFVLYELDISTAAALGADLIKAVLR